MIKEAKLSIKNWAIDDRPREKLLSKGIASLSDAELIAILIGSGNRNESAVELSRRILNSEDNNLNELSKKSIADLMKFKGIGEAKAISIVAALELGKRRKSAEIIEKKQISSSNDVFDFFNTFLGDLSYEEFWIVILNNSNKIIDKHKISQGGISETTVDVRLIMKLALDKLASGIILCHNHPSGNLKPSSADIELTMKIFEAGKTLNIKILDHIIISNSKFYSFADNGVVFKN